MRFEQENHKYFTLLEHLEDGPEGVSARITRITPRLRLDVTLQVPFTYQLPAETTQLETLQGRNHTVIHQSFDDQEKAEQWTISFIKRLKPSPSPSRQCSSPPSSAISAGLKRRVELKMRTHRIA